MPAPITTMEKGETTPTIMTETITEQIRIWGIVQGVGFRPFVAKTAAVLGMRGQVRNLGGLVELVLTDSPERIDGFLSALRAQKPLPAEIVHIQRTRVPFQGFDGFSILQSGDSGEAGDPVMIPADLALCPDCLAELGDSKNRRFAHPFISCMACGPRYTIIRKVPYDRENTAMAPFPLCPACEKEYTDLSDRRYHAQTVSCHDCGPRMQVRPELPPETDWAAHAAGILREGGVIAFKALGGYHLMADPKNPGAVAALRRIKAREQKPFAVLFRDLGEAAEYCRISGTEEELLASSARPILLLEKKPGAPAFAEDALSRFVGAFLPSLGGQILLLGAFGGPLIATSANLSGLPILTTEAEAFALMDSRPEIRAAYYHERAIDVGIDDSVVRVVDAQPQMIRRAKGYTPVPLYVDAAQTSILAAGPHLKSAFALNQGPYVYLSQFFGDLDSRETLDLYAENLKRFLAFFAIHPKAVACDLHPLYGSTRLAEDFARERDLPLYRIQHHHAHVASVMAEHNLEGEVLGVSFDGTGYGTDGKIWGGEFLLCRDGVFQRKAHLRPLPMIGGDISMKDAAKTAWCLLFAREGEDRGKHIPGLMPDLEGIFAYAKAHGTLGDPEAGALYKSALDKGINTIESSSMGRLFDGVAALLGICGFNAYEGQCAMLLEDAAGRALTRPGHSEADCLALDFHRQVARMILEQCLLVREADGVNRIALTGGVFQNRILTEETLALLRQAGFDPYYNISVGPNDGGVALGQLYIASKLQHKE